MAASLTVMLSYKFKPGILAGRAARVARSVAVCPEFNYLFVDLTQVSMVFTVINQPTDCVHLGTCLLISLPVCPCLCLSAYLTLSMHDKVMNVDGCWSSLVMSSVCLSPPSPSARPSQSLDARTATICGSVFTWPSVRYWSCGLIAGMHAVKSSRPELIKCH